MLRMTRFWSVALLVGLSLSTAGRGWSQVAYSPDVSVQIAGTVVAGESVAGDDQAGTVGLVALGALPGNVSVDAYEPAVAQQLFSLDITARLPGPVDVVPADVVGFDGTSYAPSSTRRPRGFLRE